MSAAMTLPELVFALAAGAYAINAAFGASVRLRWLDSTRFRWVHHGLYITTFLLTVAAVSSVLWSSSRAGWYLLPAVVPLAVLPYAGSARKYPRRHIAVALSALPFFILGLAVAFSV
ncbi:hypothetical protein GCM10027403_05320 [Arthrobacter tecti]